MSVRSHSDMKLDEAIEYVEKAVLCLDVALSPDTEGSTDYRDEALADYFKFREKLNKQLIKLRTKWNLGSRH